MLVVKVISKTSKELSLYQLPQEEILNTAWRAKLGPEKLSADEGISADIHILI